MRLSALLKSLCCVSQQEEPDAMRSNGRLSRLDVRDHTEEIPLTLNSRIQYVEENTYEPETFLKRTFSSVPNLIDGVCEAADDEHIYEPVEYVGEEETDFQANPLERQGQAKSEAKPKPVKKTREDVSRQFLPHIRTTLTDESVSISADFSNYSWAS